VTPLRPEQDAREEIDAALAEAGWVVQDMDDLNLSAGQGVAVREFPMAKGQGRAGYLLFVERQAVGALEAEKAGLWPRIPVCRLLRSSGMRSVLLLSILLTATMGACNQSLTPT
jgi:hypothetical protein